MTFAQAILWICGAIACAVFCVMIHSIATFREPARAGSRALRRGRLGEILWAILPILIIIGTAAPAVWGGAKLESQDSGQRRDGLLEAGSTPQARGPTRSTPEA